jgi:outer membrane protein
LLAVVLVLGSTSLFAQKFGRINMNEVIDAMPEMKDVQIKFEQTQKDYEEQLEVMQVELNNKLNDFQKVQATLSETQKQLKQRDMQELNERMQQFLQTAQQELEKAQVDLMAPLQTKADEAVKKVSKAEGLIVVFQIGTMVYLDEAQTVDITAKVKTELGITAPAAASTTAPAK